MTWDEQDAWLKEHLKKKRYVHSLGVMETAERLAALWGADPEKARRAGFLHDCAKWMTDEQVEAYLDEHGADLSVWDRKSPQILHAPAGAVMAREILGEEDPEVLSAIASHTVPSENMSVLDTVVFLADYIEPNRKGLPLLREIRDLARQDLNEAVHLYLQCCMTHLLESNRLIHPRTLEAYNRYFIEKENKE